MSVFSRLSGVFKSAPEIPYDNTSKFVIMSDCHRGCGTWADNFLNNQNLFFASLSHYYQANFSYIELGDGDELWENRDFSQIIDTHSNVFWLMSLFHKRGRLHLIYGNHDMIKKNPNFVRENCSSFYDHKAQATVPLFPNIKYEQGLILKEKTCGKKLFLVHGHQGDISSDYLWLISRLMVRYLWKPLETMGVHDPTSAAKNYNKQNLTERHLANWCSLTGNVLIAGHTHRPTLPSPGNGLYINSGSCIHPRCITSLEIERGCITLVKWSVKTTPDNMMYIGRDILEGPYLLAEY